MAKPVYGQHAITGGVLHVASDESCAWKMTIKVKPTYDSNGRLKTVAASAASKVTCPTKLSDYMVNRASIEKNGAVVKTGKVSSCHKQWCTLTYSSISWLCVARPGIARSYFFCDGYYRAQGVFIIGLKNYVWTKPAPKGCKIHSNPSIIDCTEYSPSEYVPETN